MSSFKFSHGAQTDFNIQLYLVVDSSCVGKKFQIWDSKNGFTWATITSATPLNFTVKGSFGSGGETDFIINTTLINTY